MDARSASRRSAPATALGGLSEEGRAEFWAALALRYTPGLGPRSVCRLLKHFGSAYKAVYGVPAWGAAGIPPAKGAGLSGDAWRHEARPEWEDSRDLDGRILLWTDPRYPSLLRELPDAPAFLYARGDLSLLANPCVAVVGSRACSEENRRLTQEISRDLSGCGITVVSGLARGIDRAAHEGALLEKGGSIAVLGVGLDVVYPPQHAALHRRMGHEGLLISEFPPGSRPDGTNFPIRNRLISGLSLGVLVVEAAHRSGSLITARLALEQNRAVYAVPSQTPSEYPESAAPDAAPAERDGCLPEQDGCAAQVEQDGCTGLLEQGAHPALCAADILEDLFPQLAGMIGRERRSLPDFDALPSPPRPRRPAPPIPAVPSAKPKKPRRKHAVSPPSLLSPAAPVFEPETPEGKVVAALKAHGPLLVDDLLGRGPFWPESAGRERESGKLSALLLTLELRGAVRRLPGMAYEAV